MTDRPLDEFVNESDDGDGRDDGDVSDAATPSVPTMRWSADGTPCADCGETVTRRWRDEVGFVCADCKDW